jgi:hypothetical protein
MNVHKHKQEKTHEIETTYLIKLVFYITRKVDKALMLQICIHKVPISYLSRVNDCHEFVLVPFDSDK